MVGLRMSIVVGSRHTCLSLVVGFKDWHGRQGYRTSEEGSVLQNTISISYTHERYEDDVDYMYGGQ